MLLVAMLLVSCEVKMPEDIIPPGRMESLLYDYHLAQSMASEYAANDYKEKLFFEYVFEKHSVTQAEFENSMKWYNRYPKHLKKLYASLEERLEAEVEVLSAVGADQDADVAFEMLNWDADTVELWTSSFNRIMNASMLNSHIAYGFTAPSDSSFLAGDSISLSFNTLFVNEGKNSVKQGAYAAMVVKYVDGTSDNVGVEILHSGAQALTLPRNMQSAMKSLDGFIYYFDNDTRAKAKLMLGGLSLKKISVRCFAETQEIK